MADEQYWREVLNGQRQGLGYSLMRGGLGALEWLYAVGLAGYLAAERIGLRRRRDFDVPVISIGNLSVGGTGKTPMTQWIARRLVSAGYLPAVLNRGHGGSLSPNAAVVSDRAGNIAYKAAEAGDEAVLLASTLPGVPVVVGKDRRVSGRLAMTDFGADVVVLDDGFQYWQLARDLDIVLLDSRLPFDNGHALPRGFLREPKANLSRAGIVVVTRYDQAGALDRDNLWRQVSELAPNASLFFARHRAASVRPVNLLAKANTPKRYLPVCGIAQPASFHALLEAVNIGDLAETLAFPDHQPYGDVERDTILDRLRESGADSVITTEKDAVKIPEGFIDVPLYTLGIEMAIDDEELFWETVRLRAGLTESENA